MAANKFSEILTAKVVDNKAIALSAKYKYAPFSVIGSSMTVSAQHHSIEDGTAQVTIYPQPDQDGIIAICARREWQNAEPDTFYGFLSVTWKEKDEQKYPFVELEEMWSPSERIGHMHEDVITVQIRGKTFFSSPESRIYLKLRETDRTHRMVKKEGTYVNDPNLLCRYLAGTASAIEILHFTTQTYAEESVRVRLARVLERKTELKHEVETLKKLYAEMESDRDAFSRSGRELREAATPFVNLFWKIPSRFRTRSMKTLISLIAWDGPRQ